MRLYKRYTMVCMFLAVLFTAGCSADREVNASEETARLLIRAIAVKEGGEEMADMMVQQPETQATQVCIASYLYLQNWSEEHHENFLTLTNGTGNISEPNPELSEKQTMEILAPILSAFQTCQ